MTRPVLAFAFAALVVASGVAAPAVAAAGADESASFKENYLVVTRGDSVDITVSHSAAGNLTIGDDEEMGFEVRVPLGGSGTETVTFDTYHTTAANPSKFLSRNNAELESEPLSSALEPGKYQLTVTIDGVTQAVGTLDVRARGETTGSTGAAPRGVNFEDSNPGSVLGVVTQRETVARGDHGVFLVNESGLEWAMAEESTNADVADALTGRLTQLDPERNTQPTTLTLDSSDLQVVSNVGAEDEFAVFWDTSGVPVNEDLQNRWEFALTLNASSTLVEEDQELVRERVRVVEPSVELTADPSFTLAPWGDREMRVNGTTNIAQGSELDVRALQSLPESPRAHLWTQVVTVSENGTFAAEFSFSRGEAPGSFPLWVREYRAESRETVTLTALNGSLSFPDQVVESGAVTVENVTLSHDGFVQVAGENTTYGTSAHLEAGQYDSVSVPLNESVNESVTLNATAFADANGNATLDGGDVPYNVSGEVVRDRGVVVPPGEETPTTTETTEQSDASRELRKAASEPLTPSDGGSGGSSGGTVPLSPVLVVVALAASALLGWRR